jgi:hypothetical protein
MDLLDFEASGGIHVQTDQGPMKVTIAALMEQDETSDLLALVPRGHKDLPSDVRVWIGSDGRSNIGLLKELGATFKHSEYAETIGSLFSVVVFDKKFADLLRKGSKTASVVRDLESSIFVGGRVRVRRLSGVAKRYSSTYRSNQERTGPRDRGFICGDISNITIKTAGRSATIGWAGIVVGRKGHQFAAEGDGGLPVLSRKRALVGFVVAKRSKDTLIIGAEQLAKNLNVRFLAKAA